MITTVGIVQVCPITSLKYFKGGLIADLPIFRLVKLKELWLAQMILVYRARPSSCSAEAAGRGGSSKGHSWNAIN